MGFTYIIIYLQKRQGGQKISPAGRLPAAPPSDAFRNLTQKKKPEFIRNV